MGGRGNTVSLDRLKKAFNKENFFKFLLFLKRSQKLQLTPQVLHNSGIQYMEEQSDGLYVLSKSIGLVNFTTNYILNELPHTHTIPKLK